jgi:hypothetical protein
MCRKIFLISFSFFVAQNALAYLDPASGSAILYIVISVASAGAYFFRNIAISTFNFFAVKLKFKSEKISGSNRIVFYSEGKQYWYVFQPILKWLNQNGHSCVYLTSDKKDPGLTANLSHINAKYIGNINFAGAYLAQIKADFVGMTTPQLDVLTIKRSKKVKHYAHIVHAPVDIFTYRKFAFDYFDSVFCSGSHQIDSIRFLENKRKTPEKQLLPIGCTYYDFMLEKISQLPPPIKARPTILVAPTWKDYSLLHKYGETFFDSLLKCDEYDVILRPHPQIYVSYPLVIKAIEDKFKGHPRFSIDRAPSGEGSMHKCDLLISDLSGIIWDYVFLFNKPVLLVETPLNLDGFEATELSIPMWELESIPKIGTVIFDRDMGKIDEIVSKWLLKTEKIDIKEFREKSLYNWGSAGEAAGKAIIDIVGLK